MHCTPVHGTRVKSEKIRPQLTVFSLRSLQWTASPDKGCHLGWHIRYRLSFEGWQGSKKKINSCQCSLFYTHTQIRRNKRPGDISSDPILGTYHSVLRGLNGGSARHLYVVCIYGAIGLQIQKYFPPDPAIFSSIYKILFLLYIVYRFMQKNSTFHRKTARYGVLKIKFVDISHHRYILRRDIE